MEVWDFLPNNIIQKPPSHFLFNDWQYWLAIGKPKMSSDQPQPQQVMKSPIKQNFSTTVLLIISHV